jgi:hypothetical protein
VPLGVLGLVAGDERPRPVLAGAVLNDREESFGHEQVNVVRPAAELVRQFLPADPEGPAWGHGLGGFRHGVFSPALFTSRRRASRRGVKNLAGRTPGVNVFSEKGWKCFRE